MHGGFELIRCIQMKYLILALILTLSGCATTKQVEVKVETVEVKVPVYTPCVVSILTKPSYVTQDVPSNATIYEKMQALLSDRSLSLVYEKNLEDAIAVCTKK
jgi:uncharacterized lipoprotein YajG